MKAEIAAATVAVVIIFTATLIYTQQLVPLIVLSGSMVPYIYPGDVILVKKVSPEDVQVGDVICFKSPSRGERVLITHRVVNVSALDGELIFKTKGDALEEADRFNVSAEDVVGKPVLLIPLIGYLHERKGITYISLILIPSFIVAFSEFRFLLNPELTEREEIKASRFKTYLSRRRCVNTGKFLVTLLATYAFLGILLTQDFVPVQKVAIEGGRVVVAEGWDPYEVYYLIPPFYLDLLYRINPLLPQLAMALYPVAISLLLFPIWTENRGKRKWRKRRKFLLYLS